MALKVVGSGLGRTGTKSFMSPMRDHMADRAFMTEHFRQHSLDVEAAIAPERLLIYEAGDGWEPLCKFLGAPVPDVPYPSENSRAEFIARSERGSGPIPTPEEAQKILDTDSAP